MARLVLGDTIPLSLALEDGNNGKFPQATLYRPDTTVVGTFDLALVAQGQYQNTTQLMPALSFVTAVYVVYDDAGHTIQSLVYGQDAETWSLDATSTTALTDLRLILALLHHNAVVDNTVQSVNGTVNARVRAFSTAIAAAAATDGAPDGAQGEFARWNIITDYDGIALLKTHRLINTL